MDNNDLINQTSHLQEIHNLTDGQFSERLKISASLWSRIKSGTRSPGMKFLNALVREFPEMKLIVYEWIENNGEKSPQLEVAKNKHG